MAVNGNGLGPEPTNHYVNESDRLPGLGGAPIDDGEPITIVLQEDAEEPVENIGIERADGSLIIRLDGKKPTTEEDRADAKKHDANLAKYIDERELARICDELLNGIDSDIQTRRDWMERRAAGIKHLALKVENPRSPTADADTAVEGQTTVRTPILLDAVLRFQANARGELLPAGGPVKIRNDTTLPTLARKLQMQTAMTPPDDSDMLAEALEKDFNHY